MKAKRSEKRGLGKGLGALIPVAEPEDEETVREINIEDIRPNSFQPRRAFDEEKLAEMAESVRTHGILQPVVVRSIIGGYELVAGERRWRAAQLAGLVRIPAVIRELSEGEMMEVALIENIQREDLNPLEEAEAFKILLTEFGLTQEELAQRVGKSRSHIANILRLLNLTPEVQSYVSRGTITMGHARALLALSEPRAQLAACRQVVEKGLSVRETEELLRRVPAKPAQKKRIPPDPGLLELETRIRRALSTKVRIRPGRKGGKIEIEYYSAEELERLAALLQGEGETALTGSK
ncbi:MAG TPA: ParB/RepB/Spo0J family partition protein [Firmicutes bacterium]|nr:ParB/RepB/Spo0J family partition protein [Bacillota bacterium]